eukprot:6474868-Heterocapsa_arctica.AAC.1
MKFDVDIEMDETYGLAEEALRSAQHGDVPWEFDDIKGEVKPEHIETIKGIPRAVRKAVRK